MADTDIQTDLEDTNRKANAAARRGAAAASTAVDSERRSFTDATDTARRSIKAGQDMARTSQDVLRRASDQAADFWRSSMNPMTQMQTEFGRWMDQVWRQASPARLQSAAPFAGMLLAPFTGLPPADLKMTDKALELRVELPGLKAEDIELALVGDSLVISGERRDEIEEAKGGFRLSERRFGHFERAFLLPPEADRSRIDASFTDGLLKVTIAKTAAAVEPKAIPIKG